MVAPFGGPGGEHGRAGGAHNAPVPYPPPPWRIAGPALVVPALVPLSTARANVPDDVTVVLISPSHTVGGFLLARYEGPSTLGYGELLVIPALTRTHGRTGWWISHAYVDSGQSLQGGREMWGVPKELARFTWREDGATLSHPDTDEALIEATWRTPRRTAPIPALVATNGSTGGTDRRRFIGTGTLAMAPARARVEVPASSPFASLPLAGRRPALAGRADLRLRAPRVLA